MKKLLFVVAVLALVAPATFARDYMHMTLDPCTGKQTGGTYWNSTATSVGLDQPNVNWEYDGSNSERKAESWNWPATYDWQDVCVIPVRMDVGIWIKVASCKDKYLDLKQVEIHKYSGSVTVTVTTNANIAFNASWSKLSTINLGGYSSSTGVSPGSMVAGTKDITLSLTLSSVDLSNLAGGTNCLQVGTISLQVRPNWKPSLAGGCGG